MRYYNLLVAHVTNCTYLHHRFRHPGIS